MTHFIIEGPDGAGKTTYAKQLCDMLGMAYHHEGPPPEGNVFAHYRQLLEQPTPTVFDRLHLGELVYGPLLRKKSGINFEQCRLLSDMALVTICLPPLAVCMRHLHKEEYLKDSQTLMEAYASWQRFVDVPAFMHNAVVYDRTSQVVYVSR
jgi:hypothetical protein